MRTEISPDEARHALDSIDGRRRQVVAEVGLPTWYWPGLAIGWVGIGMLADLGNVWLSAAATVAFGAVHAAVSQRVLSGRRRNPQLSVRADVAGWWMPVAVIGFLLALVAVTIGLAVAADADGADHPATLASIVVAVALVCGGPHVTAAVRRRLEHDA